MSEIMEQLRVQIEIEMLRKLVEEAKPYMTTNNQWDWVARANAILAPREPVKVT